jgi:tetratricopeptide (TPR) repeat protein
MPEERKRRAPRPSGGAQRSATAGRPPSTPSKTVVGQGRATHVDLPKDVVEEIRQIARGTKTEEALGYLSRATVLLARGDSGAAVKEAEKAKTLAGRSPAVREVLALAYYGQGRFKEALSEMLAYRRMSDRQDQNHIIGDCYRAIGEPEKAVPVTEEEVRARGVSIEAKAEAAIVGASALADMGKYDQAIATLRRFAGRTDVGRGYDLRLWYVLGDVLERAGRPGEAAAEFQRVVRHDAGAYDAAERLAALS